MSDNTFVCFFRSSDQHNIDISVQTNLVQNNNRLLALTHRCQDDVDNRLFAAPYGHLHGDAVGQRQAGPDQRVVTSPKHAWKEKEGAVGSADKTSAEQMQLGLISDHLPSLET